MRPQNRRPPAGGTPPAHPSGEPETLARPAPPRPAPAGPNATAATNGRRFLGGNEGNGGDGDGGEMGQRIRAHDWAATPLGPPEGWPQGLKTATRLLLATRHPMVVFWGETHVCLYNDAFGASLGPEKHPAILGAPGREAWAETWDVIGPQIGLVMRGEGATWHVNQLVPILRHGGIQDVYWTYGYGPLDEEDASSGVGGVLVVCTETTEQVLTERRLRASEARQAFLLDLGDRLRVPGGAAGSADSDAAGEPRAIIAAVSELLGRHLGVDRCGYGEVDPTGEFYTVEQDWTDGEMPSLAGHLHLDDFGPPLIAELRAGRSVRIDDALADPRTRGTAAAYAATGGMSAGIAVPLVRDGRFAAAFYAHQTRPRRWTADEEALVREAAERTWAALERARVEAALRATDARQALLLGLLRGQRETEDPEAMMAAAAEAVARHLGADRAVFFEMAGDETLAFGPSWTPPGGALAPLTGTFPAVGIGPRYLAEVRAGRTLGIADTAADPLTAGSRFAGIGVRAVVGAPIFRGGRWHAGLHVNHAAARAWSEAEVSLVRDVAEQTWDAVERARAGAALRESEARFRQLAEAIDQVFYVTDLDAGRLLYLSPAYERVWGRPAAEILADLGRFAETIHPDDRGRHAADKAAQERGEPVEAEYRIVRPDGGVRWIRDRSFPVQDGGHGGHDGYHGGDWVGAGSGDGGRRGAGRRAAGLAQDVTGRHLAEAERQALLDTLAHDLKNPLAAIKGQTQLLRRRIARRGVPEPADLEGRLAGMEEQADRMTELVDELGDHGRLAAGQPLDLQTEPIDLIALVRAAVAEVRLGGGGHTIRVEAPAGELTGEWDPRRLRRVVANLLGNAVKYSPAGGEILARLGWEGGTAVLTVQDAGIGIPAEDLPHVFAFRRRGGNVGSVPGSGIGLAGVRRIVEQHGGGVAVESAEGVGSTFTVRLPLAPEPGDG